MNDQFVNKTFFKKALMLIGKKGQFQKKIHEEAQKAIYENKNENEIGFMQIPEIKQRKTDVIKHCSIQWLSNEMAK